MHLKYATSRWRWRRQKKSAGALTSELFTNDTGQSPLAAFSDNASISPKFAASIESSQTASEKSRENSFDLFSWRRDELPIERFGFLEFQSRRRAPRSRAFSYLLCALYFRQIVPKYTSSKQSIVCTAASQSCRVFTGQLSIQTRAPVAK